MVYIIWSYIGKIDIWRERSVVWKEEKESGVGGSKKWEMSEQGQGGLSP